MREFLECRTGGGGSPATLFPAPGLLQRWPPAEGLRPGWRAVTPPQRFVASEHVSQARVPAGQGCTRGARAPPGCVPRSVSGGSGASRCAPSARPLSPVPGGGAPSNWRARARGSRKRKREAGRGGGGAGTPGLIKTTVRSGRLRPGRPRRLPRGIFLERGRRGALKGWARHVEPDSWRGGSGRQCGPHWASAKSRCTETELPGLPAPSGSWVPAHHVLQEEARAHKNPLHLEKEPGGKPQPAARRGECASARNPAGGGTPGATGARPLPGERQRHAGAAAAAAAGGARQLQPLPVCTARRGPQRRAPGRNPKGGSEHRYIPTLQWALGSPLHCPKNGWVVRRAAWSGAALGEGCLR